jgi:hypothetical protein
MEKLESDAELDALIAERTGMVGKTGEEDGAYQLTDAVSLSILKKMAVGGRLTRTVGT